MNARNSILVWGASGHAKVVADILKKMGIAIYGFIDEINRERHGKTFCNSVIVGGAEQKEVAWKNGIRKAIVAFGNNSRRSEVGRLLESRGYELIAAIHPTSVIGEDVTIGTGTVVAAGVVINSGCRIGKNAIINTHASVDHDCHIADSAHIGPGANLAGNVTVGEEAWCGIGCTIIEKTRIGASSIVGAGAVVIHDVSERSIVVGVPARTLRQID